MRRKTFTSLIFIMAILVTGNLMAQMNARQGSSEVQERLNAVAEHKLALQHAIPDQTDNTKAEYCIPSANCTLGDGFIDFAFAGIENYGSGCSPGGYGDFTSMQGTAEIGFTYTANIATGWAHQYVSVWIDFNNDTVFSETEILLTDLYLASGGIMYDVDITIPGDASPGIHRMRIGSKYYDLSSPDPCATFLYGEWEDYNMEITGTSLSYNAVLASIDIPVIMEPGDIIPVATVANNGIETISFPVTMTAPATGYSSTVQVVDLAMGQTLQVEFDTWTVDLGAYDVEACTYLDGDEIPDDDCQSMTIAFSDQPRQKVVSELFTGTW